MTPRNLEGKPPDWSNGVRHTESTAEDGFPEYVIPGIAPPRIWEEHIGRYFFARPLVKNLTVLDIACGTGYGSAYLSEGGVRGIISADLSKEAIGYASQHYKSTTASYVRTDAHNLPFKNSSFEAVISFETIEHLRNPKEFLAEIHRVLVEDGILVISTPSRFSFRPPWRRRPMNPFHLTEFSIDEFRQLLESTFAKVVLYGQSPRKGFQVMASYALATVFDRIPNSLLARVPFRYDPAGDEPRSNRRAPNELLPQAYREVYPLARLPGFPMYIVATAFASN